MDDLGVPLFQETTHGFLRASDWGSQPFDPKYGKDVFETEGSQGYKMLKHSWMLGVQFHNLHVELIDERTLWPELWLDLYPYIGGAVSVVIGI